MSFLTILAAFSVGVVFGIVALTALAVLLANCREEDAKRSNPDPLARAIRCLRTIAVSTDAKMSQRYAAHVLKEIDRG